KTLAEVVDTAKSMRSPWPWASLTQKNLAELTDASSYYLPRARRALLEGDYKAALAEVENGLKVIADDPVLLAERGLIRMEKARTMGRIPAEDVPLIRADAEAAVKDDKTKAQG